MQFDSVDFIGCFILVYLLYLLLPHRPQNWMLLVASYAFYGWTDWRFLLLLGFTTGFDFWVALRIAEARRRGERGSLWLAFAVTSNLLVLGFFKYFDFFAASFAAAARTLGIPVPTIAFEILLPIGISFYTFQSMAYTIDVHRGRATATSNLIDYALFIAFFPQLVAGPIERARRLLPQIANPRRITERQLLDGAWFLFWGFFKKVYVADNLAAYVDAYADPMASPYGLDAMLYGLIFLVYVYADFSGYSDMAVGLGKLMGIELTLNFRRPLWASSPSEFWRRWHITLTGWFRDYVYAIARRGNGDALSKAAAIVPTMMLVGLWHGAGWNFVIWGTIWGAALFVERLLQPAFASRAWRGLGSPALRAAGGVALVMSLHAIANQFFARPVTDAMAALRLMVIAPAASPHLLADLGALGWFVAPLLLVEAIQSRTGFIDGRMRISPPARVGLYAALAAFLVIGASTHEYEFFYFRF